MHHRPLATTLLTLAAATTLASTAHAQWTYTNLHPETLQAPFGRSHAHACDGTEVVGWIEGDAFDPSVAWNRQGCVWGSDATPIRTFPLPWPGVSALKSVWNGQYVGSRRPDGGNGQFDNGVFWNAAGEWTLLTPETCIWATTHAIYGDQQVGWLCGTWACVWYGTPESRVDLHVPGWSASEARGVWDGQQAGALGYPLDDPNNDVTHAGVWHGTRESWIDLHPIHNSEVHGTVAQCTSREQQAGYWTTEPWGSPRPCAWSGTPASWVDLTPTNANHGIALAISGGWQAGLVTINGRETASLWHGSAESWVDLRPFLPADTLSSTANGVWTDGRMLRIVGTRQLIGSSNSDRAFLLTRTLPCATDLDNDGSLANGGTPDNNVDINDLLFFLEAFEAGALAADLDNNGDPAATIPDNAVDINDLLFFLVRFEAGC